MLSQRAGHDILGLDVFVNVAGGLKLAEPAIDVGVVCALASSSSGRSVDADTVVFGEVGLAGEIRPAPRGQERLKESAKLGFSVALVPKADAPKHEIPGIRVVAVERIEEALERLREMASI